MKSIFDGYSNKKEFITEGITGFIWGFVSFIFFIFFGMFFIPVLGFIFWVLFQILRTISNADLTASLDAPIDIFFYLAVLLLFSMPHLIILRGALKKKKRAFIIFYPLGLALSILFSFNFGVIK